MVIQWSGDTSDEGKGAVTVESLYRDIPGGDYDTDDSTHCSEEFMASVKEQLISEGAFNFDEALVNQALDELLLVLVSLHTEGIHGKGLMNDLSTVFDAQPSAGTVYPRLHELKDEGLLEQYELIQSKKYRLNDTEAARGRIETALYQHLALVLFFKTALAEIEP